VEASALTIEDGAAKLAGDLTFTTVTGLYHRMQSVAAAAGMPCSINLADVGKIDSAGLALLLEWQSVFRNQNGSSALIAISNPPPALLKIARLCDAGEFLSENPDTREE